MFIPPPRPTFSAADLLGTSIWQGIVSGASAFRDKSASDRRECPPRSGWGSSARNAIVGRDAADEGRFLEN